MACAGVVVFLSDKFLGEAWRAGSGDLILLVAASFFSYYTVAAKEVILRMGGVPVIDPAKVPGVLYFLPIPKSPHGIDVDPSGKWIAAGDNDGAIVLYDAATGEKLRTMTGPRSQIRALAFSPDGALIATAPVFGPVRIWDASSGRATSLLRDMPH